MTSGPSTNNICHTYQILSKNPPTPVFNRKYRAVCRGQNSSRLLAKTDSNYHLADSVEVKMSEKTGIRAINFCKMIVDCFI